MIGTLQYCQLANFYLQTDNNPINLQIAYYSTLQYMLYYFQIKLTQPAKQIKHKTHRL
jgi:hypothetical protein